MKNFCQNILLLTSGLDHPGGTERAICNMANLFSDKGHVVTIFILDKNGTSFYPLSESVKIIYSPLHFGITPSGNILTRKYSLFRDILLLKKLVKNTAPDLIISTDYSFSISLILGGLNRHAKLISWEPHHYFWLKKNRFWRLLQKKTYPLLDRIVCLNFREKQLFEKAGCNAEVIPSFISPFPPNDAVLNSKQLLTVGWFIKRKGIDMIPTIAEIVFKKHPDWKWMLVGKGEERSKFEEAIFEKGIAGNFTIREPVLHNELQKIYADASIYVLTSRFEAFPTVLIESMAHGVPCIAFDCLTGPSDIIKDNEDGVLIQSENSIKMAEAICKLIEQDELRKKMGTNAAKNVRRFSSEDIYHQWEQLFGKL